METIPQGLKVTKVYSVPKYQVFFEFLTYEENDIDTLAVHIQQTPRESSVELGVPGNNTEAMRLSGNLGVDESMRKYLMEMTTPAIKGIIIQNHVRGIMCIIQRPISGISGKDGMIRTIEHVYSLPYPDQSKGLTITPLFYVEDLNHSPQFVYDAATDYLSMIMSHIKNLNDKILDNLYTTYSQIQEYTAVLGNKLEKINEEYYNQLKTGNMYGVLNNEDSVGRLKSIMMILLEKMKIMTSTEI